MRQSRVKRLEKRLYFTGLNDNKAVWFVVVGGNFGGAFRWRHTDAHWNTDGGGNLFFEGCANESTRFQAIVSVTSK